MEESVPVAESVRAATNTRFFHVLSHRLRRLEAARSILTGGATRLGILRIFIMLGDRKREEEKGKKAEEKRVMKKG